MLKVKVLSQEVIYNKIIVQHYHIRQNGETILWLHTIQHIFQHILHFNSDICCLDSINLLYAFVYQYHIHNIIRSALLSLPVRKRPIISTDTYQGNKHVSDRDISNQSNNRLISVH